MTPDPSTTYTAFLGPRRIATGLLHEVALAVQRSQRDDPQAQPVVFDDASGRPRDLDLRGSEDEVLARYRPLPPAPGARGRGRPKLGVVAREVTLLPEHWDWLAAQPGGASVALRKLVHEARRAGAGRERRRQAQERTYHVMSALAGDLPGFEEASRALFAGDTARFAALVQAWPEDLRAHLARLADPEFDPRAGSTA